MRFETETGSKYEVDGDRIRRVNLSVGKRGDGEWLRIVELGPVAVGGRVVMMLEPLARYGDDDYGGSGGLTSRLTSRVTWME